MKFTKFSLNQLNTLLNNEWSVNRYHKISLKNMLNNSNNNNLSKSDLEQFKLLLHTYKRVFLSLCLEK